MRKMIAALILATVSVVSPGRADHAPSWYDEKIAGYVLAGDEKHSPIAVFDKKSGYFLVRSAECDGAILSLTLTRDRKEVNQYGYQIPGFKPPEYGEQELVPRPLPSLSTGKGVRIGDTPDQVSRLLGRPSKKSLTGARKQFLEFLYKWKSGKGDRETRVTEAYTFKGGKLIEIEFVSDSSI